MPNNYLDAKSSPWHTTSKFKQVPEHLRCDAITKHNSQAPKWGKKPHRCTRKAVQSRDGKSLCAQHARLKRVVYHTTQIDDFDYRQFWKWPKALRNKLGIK